MATRANPRQTKTIGNEDTKSRSKAQASADSANAQTDQGVDSESWPRTPDGRPMAKVAMAASELIPTGNFANVMVGPVQITAFVDPQDEQPFTDAEKRNLANAANILAEICEADVVAVQRNLVLESMQEQLNGSKS